MKAAVELAASAYSHPVPGPSGTFGTENYTNWLDSAQVKEKIENLAFTLRENVKIRRITSVSADAVGMYVMIHV